MAPLMAGPAIRVLEMARALRDVVHPVIATPYPVTRDMGSIETREYRFDRPDLLARAAQDADAVLVQGFTLRKFPFLADARRPLIVDLYCPFHLENLERRRLWGAAGRDHAAAVDLEVLVEQLRRGTFFICASERQRDYWIGMLTAVGRVTHRSYDANPDLRDLIEVVPFGIDDRPPARTGSLDISGIHPDDRLLVWAGSVLDWQDPGTPVRALARTVERVPTVRLIFPGGSHPNPETPPSAKLEEVRALARARGMLDRHVFFVDWIPYDRRADLLLAAEIGLSAHHLTLETRYAWRTRMLDYLWAGLPIVCTEGDALAELVQERQLGCVVPPGDEAAMAAAFERLLTDGPFASACRARIADVRPSLHWTAAVAPLRRYLERLEADRGDDAKGSSRRVPAAPHSMPGASAARGWARQFAQWLRRRSESS